MTTIAYGKFFFLGGQDAPEWGGQLRPESGGQYHRFFHETFITKF